MKFSVLLMGQHPQSELAALIDLAEDLGYSIFWYADERFFREVYVGLTMAALRTKRISLGTLVTDPYSRHPAMTAAAIGSIAELAPGRTILGIGAGGSGFQPMRIEREKPQAAIREAVELIRRLLVGGRVTFSGEVISFRDGWLEFGVEDPVPIYIASSGRRILTLGGEVGDGVVIGSIASDRGLRQGMHHIGEGALAAARDVAAIDISARVDLAIAADRQAAYAAVKPEINYGLWFGYGHFDKAFLDYDASAPEWQIPADLLNQLAKRDWSLVIPTAHRVPDGMVPLRALAGTVEDVIQNCIRIARHGIRHITVYPLVVPGDPLGGSFASQMTLFATEVMPRVQAALDKETDK